MAELQTARVDQWLWAVRMYKTRTDATAACRGGHVKVNGVGAKAATTIKPGDRIGARIHTRDRDLEVVRVIDKRVGAPVAVECYVDHSPPPPEAGERIEPLFGRERGAGRPTKRDRRDMDRLRRH